MKMHACLACHVLGPSAECVTCTGKRFVLERADTDRNDIPAWMRDTADLVTLPDSPEKKTPTERPAS